MQHTMSNSTLNSTTANSIESMWGVIVLIVFALTAMTVLAFSIYSLESYEWFRKIVDKIERLRQLFVTGIIPSIVLVIFFLAGKAVYENDTAQTIIGTVVFYGSIIVAGITFIGWITDKILNRYESLREAFEDMKEE